MIPWIPHAFSTVLILYLHVVDAGPELQSLPRMYTSSMPVCILPPLPLRPEGRHEYEGVRPLPWHDIIAHDNRIFQVIEDMAHYFLKNQVSFIKLINPPVNGLSLAVRDGNYFTA